MKKNHQFDWITIITYTILVICGFISIYSSSYENTENSIISFNQAYGKQLLFIILSFICGIFILIIDLRFFTKMSYLIYIFTIFLLVLVLIIGKEVGGAKAWFDLGLFGLQPAEFAKYSTILAIAKYMHDNDIYLNSHKYLINVFIITLIPILLILLQPDAGSAIIFFSLIIMFFREGFPIKYILTTIAIALISISTLIFGVSNSVILMIIASFSILFLLKNNKKKIIISLLSFIFGAIIISSVEFSYSNILGDHQKERIDIILGKETNKLGSGYNLNQSLIAIGSGGFLGKGYLNGTQTKFNFIPEQNTDFIFCTVGEEFGFLGSLFTIFIFLVLIIRLIVLSEKQTSRFTRIVGYSLVSIIFSHVFINISMTIGLMPVIGIPLPFFSYGGSSLLSFSFLLFTFIKLDASRNQRF